MNQVETYRYSQFRSAHQHPENDHGAIGGHISIRVTPTSIGDAFTCICGNCGSESNITDYESW